MARNFIDQLSVNGSEPLDVVIVGGSLTGLIHGIVLKRLGHNVRILEQYESSTREGQAAGISAMEYGTEFLAKYDLLVDKSYAVKCAGVQFLDRHAKVKFKVAHPLTMTSWNVLYYRFQANFDGLRSSYSGEPPLGTAKDGEVLTSPVEYADTKGGGRFKPDLVIAADGSTSHVRKLLQPTLQRSYAGYAIWRGTVLEKDVSDVTRKLFESRTTIMSLDKSYIALYTIPGENGTIEPGDRLLNYVWYCNYAEDSQERVDAMTDVGGKRHHTTLPIGKMSPKVWDKQKALAAETLLPPFVELINKTTQPFITIVTDQRWQ